MNWILDIICIAIITLTIAFAVRNGFVKTLVSAASFLIAVFITFCFASQLSDALRSTPVADRIRESTREKIEDLVLESTGSGESLLNGENEAFNTLLGLAGYSIDEAREWVKGESHDSFAAVIADKISEPVIGAVCTALAVIILYFGTKLALAVAAWLLDKLMKLIKENSGKIRLDSTKPNQLILSTGKIGLKEKSEYIREKLETLI